MPRHVNPPNDNSVATAPYNFVPLPLAVFEVPVEQDPPWTQHDRFVPGTHSGSIELEIETLTPLYIRGVMTADREGRWSERPSRLRPDPYMTPDGSPVIPGSSLRGMIRTLVEILSFSKLRPVSAAKPFYRSLGKHVIGKIYRERMTRGGQKPRGGILHIRDGSVTIAPCEFVRVGRDRLRPGHLSHDHNPPPWPPQHAPCWVRMPDRSDTVVAIEIRSERPAGAGWRRGTLVLTGHVKSKRREFVFLEPSGTPKDEIQVPDPVWRRFHDDDQITQWQKWAFPRGQPPTAGRCADGHLRDGEPVFFLADDRADGPPALVFLGRAGMFRLPYDRSPRDLVDRVLPGDRLDLTESIFGTVETSSSDDRQSAIKGRVRFEDAMASGGGPHWYESTLVPHILSAPKPTAFQHYLTQGGTVSEEKLTTYLDGHHTTVRGHKLYWHRWSPGQGMAQVKATNHDPLLQDLRTEQPEDTQHTLVTPVKQGVRFTGRVRFENLTDLELGALLHALQLPDGCCHRIGMAKPLGLGSIRIRSTLRLVDRAARYRAWETTGVQPAEDGHRFKRSFENAVHTHATTSGETTVPDQPGLRRIARLDALYRLLAWDDRPRPGATAYMDLDAFKQRAVLPTPHHVADLPEPRWEDDPPHILGAPPERHPRTSRPRDDRRTHAPDAAHSPPSLRDGRTRSRVSTRPATPHNGGSAPSVVAPAAAAAPAPIRPKAVEQGQTRPGTLLRVDGRWAARFEGDDRPAKIINPSAIPANCEGASAIFFITQQNKREGISCRFEQLAQHRGPAPAR